MIPIFQIAGAAPHNIPDDIQAVIAEDMKARHVKAGGRLPSGAMLDDAKIRPDINQAQLIRDYQAGMPFDDLRRKHRTNNHVVRKILDMHDVPSRNLQGRAAKTTAISFTVGKWQIESIRHLTKLTGIPYRRAHEMVKHGYWAEIERVLNEAEARKGAAQ